MKTKFLFVVLLLVVSVSVFSAWQLPITNYPQKEYGAGTQTWQIKQQYNGWLYFANNYGLLEFDGQKWGVYGIWNSTVIRSLEIGEEGQIYVGGTNEYGVFESTDKGTLQYIPLSLNVDERYKNFGEVWNIHRLHDDLYIQTRNYFFKQNDKGVFEIIEPKSRIYCSAKIRDGLFVATADGIYLLTGSHLNAIQGSEQLRGLEIRSMLPYGSKSVLIATDFGGLFIFDGDKISQFVTDADDFIRQNQLYTMSVCKNQIAVGTVMGGLVILDIGGKNPQYFNNKNGLQNNTILSLFFDENTNLWMGLDNGISMLTINTPLAQLYSSTNFYGSGYSLLIDDNELYLATNQGVFCTDYPIDQSKQLTNLIPIKNSLGQAWNLNKVGNSILCAHNRGLFSVEGDQFVPIITDEGCWKVIELLHTSNRAIVGSYSGFYLIEKRGDRWYNRQKINGFDATSRVFELDSRDRAIVLTVRGVERVTFNKDFTYATSEVLQASVEANNEYFGIHKIGDKIFVSNRSNSFVIDESGEVISADEINNLLLGQDDYSAVKKDDDNNVWFVKDMSLYVRRYDKIKKEYNEGVKQVFKEPYFFIGGFEQIFTIAEDSVILSGVDGFALCSIKNRRNRIYERPLFIRKITTTLNDSIIYGQSYPIRENVPKIDYKYNSINIEYSQSLSPRENQQYSVKLEPIESEWSVYSTNTTKEYTLLKEGEYTFYVRTPEGAEQKATFKILPPWYRSWWIYVIYALCGLLILQIIYLNIKRRMERSRRKLEILKNKEIEKREQAYKEEANKREKEIIRLQNEQLELELKSKSQELASILLNHVNKNEILLDIKGELKKISKELQEKQYEQANRRILLTQGKINRNIEQNIDWNQFEENFDIVHNQFIHKLQEKFPWLNKNERKLCVYIKMGLLTKEIAPLLNMSVRGVEMLRYRIRKKMELEHENGLQEFFQLLEQVNSEKE